VAIRKLVAVQTEGVFFPMPQYEFFCYVTNLPHAPWHIHKLYGQRATSENWISWCKSQMASGTIRTGVFWANSAIFQSCILAYNLMVWMMWLTSEKSFHEEPEQSFIFPAFCLTRFGGDILTTNNIRDKYAYYMAIYRYRGYQVGLP